MPFIVENNYVLSQSRWLPWAQFRSFLNEYIKKAKRLLSTSSGMRVGRPTLMAQAVYFPVATPFCSTPWFHKKMGYFYLPVQRELTQQAV